MDENKIFFIKPFGPSIAKVQIPEKIITDLNNYIDEITKNEKKSDELSHGSKLVGNVKQEIKIEKEIAEKTGWLQFLANASGKWIEQFTQKRISQFKMLDTWVVRQFENEYNPIHWHSGHISGAGFLKVPSSFGNTVQKNKPTKSNLNGKLELVSGNRAFMSNSRYVIDPKVGVFFIFPHYLMHVVYPFNGNNEERRSISFNAKIDNNIFDVFAGH